MLVVVAARTVVVVAAVNEARVESMADSIRFAPHAVSRTKCGVVRKVGTRDEE